VTPALLPTGQEPAALALLRAPVIGIDRQDTPNDRSGGDHRIVMMKSSCRCSSEGEPNDHDAQWPPCDGRAVTAVSHP
jgi:hypothetical protein